MKINNRKEDLYSFTKFESFNCFSNIANLNFNAFANNGNNYNAINNNNLKENIGIKFGSKRLDVFNSITKTKTKNSEEGSLSTSVSSNEESFSPPNSIKGNSNLYQNFMSLDTCNNFYLNQASFFPKNFIMN